jgi:hypothetical protein
MQWFITFWYIVEKSGQMKVGLSGKSEVRLERKMWLGGELGSPLTPKETGIFLKSP